MPEMIFIFLLALILFGPKKLPEIGREIGKFLAEFKRASNDFKSQIQSEIEKAGVDMPSFNQTGGQQQSSSFTQTLLPPAVTSTIKEIDEAQERLMRAARLAFEAQSFTLRPPETPVVAQQASEAPAAPPEAQAAAATSPDQPVQPTTSANATEAAAAPLQSNPAVQSS